jgi:hypothetical protein
VCTNQKTRQCLRDDFDVEDGRVASELLAACGVQPCATQEPLTHSSVAEAEEIVLSSAPMPKRKAIRTRSRHRIHSAFRGCSGRRARRRSRASRTRERAADHQGLRYDARSAVRRLFLTGEPHAAICIKAMQIAGLDRMRRELRQECTARSAAPRAFVGLRGRYKVLRNVSHARGTTHPIRRLLATTSDALCLHDRCPQ